MRRKLKQFSTRIDLLNDAIAYYWGREERKCYNSFIGCCTYYPTTPQTDGCAIGRLIPLKLCKMLDKTGDGISYDGAFAKLPLWLQLLGQNFLTKLQALHDSNDFVYKNKEGIMYKMMDYVNVSKIIFPD